MVCLHRGSNWNNELNFTCQVESYGRKIAEEMEKLNQLETEENKGCVFDPLVPILLPILTLSLPHLSPSSPFQRVLQQLRALVALNQSLKKQEQQFKAYCKVCFSDISKCFD